MSPRVVRSDYGILVDIRARALVLKCSYLLGRGRAQTVEKNAQSFLSWYPGHPEALKMLAYGRYYSHKWEAACEPLRELIARRLLKHETDALWLIEGILGRSDSDPSWPNRVVNMANHLVGSLTDRQVLKRVIQYKAQALLELGDLSAVRETVDDFESKTGLRSQFLRGLRSQANAALDR